jgi:hypothetical protein
MVYSLYQTIVDAALVDTLQGLIHNTIRVLYLCVKQNDHHFHKLL